MKRKKKHRCVRCGFIYERNCSRCSNDKENFGGNRLTVLERDNYKCVRCGMTNEEHLKRWGIQITVDHIDRQGSGKKKKNNALSNLQTLCKVCHIKKDYSRFPKTTIKGESKTLKEWAFVYGVPYKTLRNRMHQHKMPLMMALTKPVLYHPNHKHNDSCKCGKRKP